MPPALAALVVVVAILGVGWALLVPPWQSPDENNHFAYAQSLAERGALPQASGRPGWSSDQGVADYWSNASPTAHFSDQLRFDWSPQDAASYRAQFGHHPSRSNGGGTTGASSNPPLYYLYADLAYWATYPATAFGRLYAMRLWTVALLVLTVVAAWLLAGEVLGRRRLPQLACAASVGLIPMLTSISASVNPDGLVIALWTVALWLGARVIIRGAQRLDVIALSAITAAAILTKASSYALVPAALFALAVGLFRRPKLERRRLLLLMCGVGVVFALPVVGWVSYQELNGHTPVNVVGTSVAGQHSPFNISQFLSYMWQFYLPRLPGMTGFRTTPGLPLYDVWIRESWGVFGWLDVWLPAWLYGLLAGLTAAVAVASAAIVAGFRDRVRLSLVGFFALGAVVLLLGLHETEYRAIIGGQTALLQGRYALPLIGLFGLAVGLVVSRLPAKLRAPTCGGVLAALLILQILSLATVAQRYYT